MTGAVNYAFEWRRDRAKVRVAVRLLEGELLFAAAQADWRIEQGAWSPWNFESAHRTWGDHRADIAQLPPDDWYSVSRGYWAIDQIERRFSSKPSGGRLSAEESRVVNQSSESILEGANTLRRYQGLEEVSRFGGPDGEPND